MATGRPGCSAPSVASSSGSAARGDEVAQLDAALRLLPPVTLAGFGLIPDPRLSRVPANGAEFREMVATSWGRRPPWPLPLAWAGQSGALADPRARYSLIPGASLSRLPSSRRG
jgi:hypothetical protein